MAGPDLDFWQRRFAAGDTPWDRGAPGPQLQRWWAEGVIGPGARIAVPGCGSGHDVAWLAQAGAQVTGLDLAPAALVLARQTVAAAGPGAAARATLVEADVTRWTPAEPFDAVYEQTCWCALHPDHWREYTDRLHDWLRPGGRLLLMLMQAPRPGAAEGRLEGPPYHVDVHGARALLTDAAWQWPAPPYTRIEHPRGWAELGIVLERR
jgi:SAM-dependent methyltransferase